MHGLKCGNVFGTQFTACSSKCSCQTCRLLQAILDEPIWKAIVENPEFSELFKVPVDFSTGDNTWPWGNFSYNQLGLSANVCSTHATGNTCFVYIYIFIHIVITRIGSHCAEHTQVSDILRRRSSLRRLPRNPQCSNPQPLPPPCRTNI